MPDIPIDDLPSEELGLLSVQGLVVTFGGLVAVDGATFDAPKER